MLAPSGQFVYQQNRGVLLGNTLQARDVESNALRTGRCLAYQKVVYFFLLHATYTEHCFSRGLI